MPPTMTLRAKGVTSPPASELPMPKAHPTRMARLGRATFVAAGVLEGVDEEVIKICLPLTISWLEYAKKTKLPVIDLPLYRALIKG